MGKTMVMTLRLPEEVGRAVGRLAARSGHRPAHIGARLIEEGLRRRDFPLIDLRETVAGQVAYLKGTRLAVSWVASIIDEGQSPERFAPDHELTVPQVRAALAYAAAFPKEMEMDLEHVAANRRWIEQQDASWRATHIPPGARPSLPRRNARR